MSFLVRDGKFDVVIVAGPRVDPWPSTGVRLLSSLCADMGLEVGVFGGEALMVRGVIPLPATGALVMVEDIQGRIHRVHARAVVRLSAVASIPDPFSGWRSDGMVPISTAEKLLKSGSNISWGPATVVLGTGNRALRLASALLESGVPEVFCVESFAQWGAKRFAGWEVERRRLEINGGRMIEATPVKLTPKAPLVWEFRLRDAQGVRVIDVARVVSAGPFRDLPGVREYPTGSFLFELEQTACFTKEEDVDGWALEEERARWIALKIVKALASDLAKHRYEYDRLTRRTKGRLKRYQRHREEPFTPGYQGKWVSVSDSRRIRAFEGVPKELHQKRMTASIECFESISCQLCQMACPEGAIAPGRVLNEALCTGCGACLTACPSGTALMLQEREDQSLSPLVLSWRGRRPWKGGEFATLVNRRGEVLGSARVVSATPEESDGRVQSVQLEVPTHLIWEARGLRRLKTNSATDEAYFTSLSRSAATEGKVEITLNGEKRRVRDLIPLSTALFEVGQSRPGDVLMCKDGSCGLCQVLVDGVKKRACQTEVHRGMAVRLSEPEKQADSVLCPCLGITRDEVVERLKQGHLSSPEAVLSVTHVGEGKCHGQLCMEAFRRVLLDQGLDLSQWIDWRFPWSEWILVRN